MFINFKGFNVKGIFSETLWFFPKQPPNIWTLCVTLNSFAFHTKFNLLYPRFKQYLSIKFMTLLKNFKKSQFSQNDTHIIWKKWQHMINDVWKMKTSHENFHLLRCFTFIFRSCSSHLTTKFSYIATSPYIFIFLK